MSLHHLFKMIPKQREAVCGYVACADPKSVPQDKAFPRCEDCMAWFKSLCWKPEPRPTAKEGEEG